MKDRYRLFRRRGGVYYLHDSESGKQESLRTDDKAEARQIANAKNGAARQPMLNLTLAKTFLSAHDAKMLTRIWNEVFDQFQTHGRESSRSRSKRAAASKAFDLIRNKPIIETTADDFLSVLSRGGAATNNYLRRFHNLALDFGWLLAPVLPKRAWPSFEPKHKRRAITAKEYERIIANEQNPARRKYYQLLWETGAAQTDAALITAESIDWEQGFLIYERKKLKGGSEPCRLAIGPTLKALLRTLPQTGLLFPSIAKADPRHRSAEFWRRCRILEIDGVSLHSFRYSWAERAFKAGYPERYAQAALGHSSKAVHRAYSRGAKVLCPSLETYESKATEGIIPFPQKISAVG